MVWGSVCWSVVPCVGLGFRDCDISWSHSLGFSVVTVFHVQ